MLGLEADIEAQCIAFEAAQRHLKCARQGLEKRILEYDTAVAEGRADSIASVALQMIKEQEGVVKCAVQKSQVRPMHAPHA
jgi:hypothetical protein